MTRLYLQLQDRPHAKRVEQLLREQDAVHEMYSNHGIVNGTPGKASESDVMGMLHAIQNGSASQDEKWEALEALEFYTINNVENGRCTDVFESVLRAKEDLIYGGSDE